MVLSYEPPPPSVTCGDIMKKRLYVIPFGGGQGKKNTVILAGLGGRKCAAELFLRSSWKTLLE